MGQSKDWLQPRDSEFLAVLRALSIVVIVFGHVGGFWIYPPWSEFLQVFVPIFFFISGAVSYNGYLKSESATYYVVKRIIVLLVPYYCMCIIALLVYVVNHAGLPSFSLSSLMKWIAIRAAKEIFRLVHESESRQQRRNHLSRSVDSRSGQSWSVGGSTRIGA